MKKQAEKRVCQNCKKDFTIEPDDFSFYEKIKVPPPTFCPECRKIRRMNWRNERTLYHRNCDLCRKNIISVYPKDTLFPVYCYECWWGDKWDPGDYGQEFDFSKSIFQQILELSIKVPHQNLNVLNNVNSPYINQAWNSKNSYMCFDLGYSENVLYSNACHFVKDSVDNSYAKKLDLCYQCIDTRESSMSCNLENCKNCLDSHFLFNCNGCSSCILCSNLRNKSFCILNKQHTKEEYEKLKDIYFNGSFSVRTKAINLFNELKLNSIRRENNNIQIKNCTGNTIWNSENCKQSFNVYKSQNCKFVNDIDSDLKDSMDLSNAAEGELMYEGTAVSGHNLFFDVLTGYSLDVSYSASCLKNNTNCFACIGLRNKQFCILNKQYTKEQYESLVPKIIQHMNDMPYIDSKGRVYKYGEFFPSELSPFAYNETIAQEYFPLTKEQAIDQGYKWKDKEERNYTIDIKNNDIPDDIKDTDESIVSKIIECAHKDCNHQCTEAFKIIPEEYQFYHRMNLPLPRLCPNCRHYERLSQRNPLKLWHRQCMKDGCPNEFETSYSPERPEIIYCESCYQREVY
ncbi:MAG: hypothetical protein WC603_01775 [Candidatus Paceibacterota bacterium]|jgi:hypothetical protein